MGIYLGRHVRMPPISGSYTRGSAPRTAADEPRNVA